MLDLRHRNRMYRVKNSQLLLELWTARLWRCFEWSLFDSTTHFSWNYLLSYLMKLSTTIQFYTKKRTSPSFGWGSWPSDVFISFLNPKRLNFGKFNFEFWFYTFENKKSLGTLYFWEQKVVGNHVYVFFRFLILFSIYTSLLYRYRSIHLLGIEVEKGWFCCIYIIND